jgi:HD-GYP domain-containing protein (c-di-GMP phosphodiesterase class II)
VSERLRLADLLAGLSIASDLGFGLPPEEAMRSCLIATALARHQGVEEAVVAETFYTALLMHVGCTALSHETAAVFGDEHALMGAAARTDVSDPADVAETMLPQVARGRSPAERGRIERYLFDRGREFGRRFDVGSCEVASATARRLGLGGGIERALYEVVEWWNGEGPPRGLEGEEIARPARIARVAADAARFDHLGGSPAVVEAVSRRSGGILDPAIVEELVAGVDRILDVAHGGDPRESLLESEPDPVVEIDVTELPDVAAAFGDLADLKTPWMHGHSGGVARLAREAAESLRLDRRTTSRLEVSALLQDIGRVAVSNAIWEKPGPLTGAEWEQVRMHPYYSERILATSTALEPMARAAGMHHERLDGSGYHRGCRRRELPSEALVLAAADAFHAMTQRRPHRAPLTAEQASGELKKEVRAGRLDADAVAAILEAAGQRPARRRDRLRPGGLSERQVEVARLVAAGYSNPEIAEHLVISRRTAEHHVQHIYTKVGVSSRAALALYVHEHGLLSTDVNT